MLEVSLPELAVSMALEGPEDLPLSKGAGMELAVEL